eukprot:6180833-Pleurochrysis_carterae.AAC.1
MALSSQNETPHAGFAPVLVQKLERHGHRTSGPGRGTWIEARSVQPDVRAYQPAFLLSAMPRLHYALCFLRVFPSRMRALARTRRAYPPSYRIRAKTSEHEDHRESQLRLLCQPATRIPKKQRKVTNPSD